jgi:carbon-monoxide dehydrogenase medium subunit
MRYEAPETPEAAAQLLAGFKGEAKILAGGTDLLVQMKTDMVAPELIVDIKRIAETRRISDDGGAFTIGAAVTGAELKEHAALRKTWPGIVEGANLIGSTQVQGRATLGGNLCNASPAADGVPTLIAADAKVVIAGPNGRREVAVADVAIRPRHTSLSKGEFVVAIKLPKKPANTGDAYLRFIPRTEMDIAVVGCGVVLTQDGKGVVTAARVSLGAVAERALLVPEAGAALVDSKLDKAALEKLEAAARKACRPIDDKRGTKEFRIDIAGVLARRTALIAYERAGGKA